MNLPPKVPNITCPPVAAAPLSYVTSQQSELNVSRKDRFILVMDIPEILKPHLRKEKRICHGGDLDRLSMSIWGFVVPEIKTESLIKPYNGQHLKFSGLARPAFAPVTVNFVVDNRFDNYFIIYKWLDVQNDDIQSQYDGKGLTSRPRGSLCEYSSTFTVFAVDEYETPTARWDYIGAFPISLGNITTTSRETAELENSFTFEFSQLKMALV